MIKIKAIIIKETEKAWLFDCEGDKVWMPKSQCTYCEEEKALEIPEWLYEDKFPEDPSPVQKSQDNDDEIPF